MTLMTGVDRFVRILLRSCCFWGCNADTRCCLRLYAIGVPVESILFLSLSSFFVNGLLIFTDHGSYAVTHYSTISLATPTPRISLRLDCDPTMQSRALLISSTLCSTVSPRVILVEDHGSLVGLVTVKDVLRFIATEKPGAYDEPSWDERGGARWALGGSVVCW
ncbi:hypothetical protein BT96DRAFT_195261 [Gymnopus androsaceus JB14]|uniref:CBS domain-containing protein n=1 Tax=Gymnopus androsaceus JB14 TaxID=1447944 RepID=A0A6A4H7Q7_9AGAR|nr:hypothetical protein BT96DRAFT_195261 [Gymnopus androsaceus JB14]